MSGSSPAITKALVAATNMAAASSHSLPVEPWYCLTEVIPRTLRLMLDDRQTVGGVVSAEFPVPDIADVELIDVLRAVADPIRLEMIRVLADGEPHCKTAA